MGSDVDSAATSNTKQVMMTSAIESCSESTCTPFTSLNPVTKTMYRLTLLTKLMLVISDSFPVSLHVQLSLLTW